MSTSMLAQAVTFIHAGNKAAARQILLKTLQTDQQNENAWLWLAYTYSGSRCIYCLERALEINPSNLQTRQALARLNRSKGPRQAAIPAEILPAGSIIFSPNVFSFLMVRTSLAYILLLAYLHGHLTLRCVFQNTAMFLTVLYIITLLGLAALFLSPFYRVEVSHSHLTGPARIEHGLARVKVSLNNLDLQNMPVSPNLFGLYSIPTRSGSKMLLLAFTKNEYEQLLDLIRARTILAKIR